jgi:predicted nucleic acid-binding protein
MIFVDTGFFLALAQQRDALHLRAVAWAGCCAEPLLVTEFVLLEMLNSMSARIDRGKAHAMVSSIRSSGAYEIVAIAPNLFEAGLQLHTDRPDKEWSLTDCISFVVMEERKVSRALAYDHHFEQAGFEALLRRDPP